MFDQLSRKKSNIALVKFKVKNSFMINYSYLVFDINTKKAVIIDPSWEENRVLSFLKDNSIELEKILITHSHYDHTKMIDRLLKEFPSIKVFAHEYESKYEGFKCKNLNLFNSESRIPFSNSEFICLHTPGHTEGSTSYLIEDFLFTGDFLFIEGCGLCSTVDEAQKLYKSVQLVRERVTPETQVFPGHCYEREPGLPFSFLLTYNVYFHMDEERFVKFRLRANQKNLFSFK